MKDVFLYQVMPQWRFQQYIFTYVALKKLQHQEPLLELSSYGTQNQKKEYKIYL